MVSEISSATEEKRVVLTGEISIEYAGDIRNRLLESLNQADKVVVDVTDVSEISLSGMQLLCAAHRTSLERKKTLTLGGTIPGIFREAAKAAGFNRHTGCAAGRPDQCLWIEGE